MKLKKHYHLGNENVCTEHYSCPDVDKEINRLKRQIKRLKKDIKDIHESYRRF
jgi:peptidoglycan hydrolase CwlO-like protein